MADLLKGAPVAQAITEDLINRCEALKAKGIQPCLAMVKLGNDEADASYERNAVKRCEKVGITVKHFDLPEKATRAEVLGLIKQINEDISIHACLMFRPIYDKDLENEVAQLLSPAKDVDAMTPQSLASVFLGRGQGFSPCTAQACIEILDYYGVDLTGKNVCVIGRSPVVGKPLSMLLQNKNATVTMCHTKTRDLPEIARKSEVLLVAAGHPNTVTKEFVNDKQIIVDVGINVVDGNLCGDCNFNDCEPAVFGITPVPGGVGAVTTSVLAKHIIEAAESLC
ncbi:MAG: bifunctional 5,10-methylenetetrahydrofolate dehydrogenase/5,10-methenyltetrahydrofolate cyclohydrolase [Bacillota bacterium]|nr:bifunctional 5,10-methylenetetrahydrofolate dehydrogenase/5,10-methenyltetrahydrofolate cyclohydrolase [Bacillota bacterium]